MIVYAYDKGEYITLEESLKRQPEGKRAIYVNLTNRCTCSCTFCLRSMKKMAEETTLWLKKEPTVADVKALLDAAPWDYVGEVVFCGFGEPTLKLPVLIEIARELKKRGAVTRINTNGQANLIWKRDVTEELAECIDKINVSLNEANARDYAALCRPAFGEAAFEGLQDFAKKCAARKTRAAHQNCKLQNLLSIMTT